LNISMPGRSLVDVKSATLSVGTRGFGGLTCPELGLLSAIEKPATGTLRLPDADDGLTQEKLAER
jgi:hypothetical protein